MSKKTTIILLAVTGLVALSQSAMATPVVRVPDVGSSALLLGSAVASLVGFRAFLRRKS